jgi:ABC-type multidrug transport system ATPase subunit
VIVAKDIHKVYRGKKKVHAVAGNTLGVRAGGITGLLGPNGAGKSTTFNMLAMQDRRTSGDLILIGTPIEKINFGQ